MMKTTTNNNKGNNNNKKGFRYYAKYFAVSAAIALPMLFKSLGGSDMAEVEEPQVLAETIDYDQIKADILADLDLDSLKGQNGINGVDGKDGINGVDGKDGINGVDGKDGIDGVDGKDGIDGVDGKDGINGVDGKDGINGVDGKDGIDGKDGSSVTFDVIEVADGYQITFTDKNHSETIVLKNGSVETKYVEVEHKYTSTVTKEATCTATGVRTFTCDSCDDTYTEVIPATGHSYSVASSVVNEDSTVTVTYVCDNCDDTYSETVGEPVHRHVALDPVKENVVEATCCKKGSYDVVVYCQCGEEMSRETIIVDALGHDYVTDETTAVEPQIGVEGKEADKICSRCGDVITGQTIDALVDYSTTRCEFNEFGWGFYTNLEGEEICTTRGAYRDYLSNNYPNATICEDEIAIWCE